MSLIKVASLLYLTTLFAASEEKCRDDNVCFQMRTHGMMSADCFNKNFKNFPRCLRKDVEIIDLSYNRLRKITREDLRGYASLKMLYLSDNLLTNLDNSTFQDLNQLVSLDLSLNGISKLPPVIFHLPSLKRLYLSQNQNINIIEVIDETKPVTSPLESIDIGFNELDVLPSFGIMPHLWLYNVSGNNPLNMELTDLAGMCNLHKFVNNNFTAYFGNPCDCWNIQRWLRERDVEFVKINCEMDEEDCQYDISEEALAMFNECKARTSEMKRKSMFLTISIIAGSIALVLVVAMTAFFIYRRRKNKKSKLRELEIYAANARKETQGLM